MPDIWLVSTVVCTTFEIWHNHYSVQSNASFHKHKCEHIHRHHYIHFIIIMDSWDVSLILGRKTSKSLFYHKIWVQFQLTDFWHKCWTPKDTEVNPSAAIKALQSLFVYFFVTHFKLMYLISIGFNQSRWLGEVPEEQRNANITLIFKNGKEDPGNYRPISLTSNPGRVMEQLILETTSRHIKDK